MRTRTAPPPSPGRPPGLALFCVSELLTAVAPGRRLAWAGRATGGFAAGLVLVATYLEVARRTGGGLGARTVCRLE
jgi:predicted MFS family arabinose efflux permease